MTAAPPGPRHRGIVVWLPLAALAAVLLLVGPRHEPWFDEAQAWLIARDNSLPRLFFQVRYEGSPTLWHLLLWVLIRLGLPYAALWTVSAALALAGAAVVLTRAPFPAWLRVATIFSYFFAYQYAVVARSYALDLLIVPLLAARFERRTSAPIGYALLLGAMANANAHGFILAAVLAAEMAWRGLRAGLPPSRRMVVALAAYALLALAAAASAWPQADGSFIRPGSAVGRGLTFACELLVDRIDPFLWRVPAADSQIAGLCLSLILLIPLGKLFHRAGHGALFVATIGALLLFSIVKYVNAWHAGIAFLAWLLTLWVSWPALAGAPRALRLQATGAAGIILGLSCCSAMASLLRDYREPYSAGIEAAAALRGGAAPGGVAAFGFKAFAVQPYFDHNLFANYERGAPWPSFYDWRMPQSYTVDPQLSAWRRAVADPRVRALLLAPERLEPAEVGEWAHVARQNGFCFARRFAGALIWKGYDREDDGALLFRRCGAAAISARSARRPPGTTG